MKIKKKTLKTIIGSLAYVAIIAFSVHLIASYLKLPLVQYSSSTQKCVQVIPESAGSCNNLPNKYISEWIK